MPFPAVAIAPDTSFTEITSITTGIWQFQNQGNSQVQLAMAVNLAAVATVPKISIPNDLSWSPAISLAPGEKFFFWSNSGPSQLQPVEVR